jgi:hypothetical protein
MTIGWIGMNSDNSVDEKQKPTFVDISTLDLYPLLQFFITILSEKAWRYIGLRVNPVTGDKETDFGRAHATIDCILFLLDKLEQNLTENKRNQLRNLVTDLQINYARQVEGERK